MGQKSPKNWATFVGIFVAKKVLKIAQSGHTAHRLQKCHHSERKVRFSKIELKTVVKVT